MKNIFLEKIINHDAFNFVLGLIAGASIVVILSCLNLIQINQKTYAYVDVDLVIKHVSQKINNKQIADNQLEQLVTSVRQIFGQELAHYSKKRNALVFNKDKVIAGGKVVTKDITSYFIGKITKELSL